MFHHTSGQLIHIAVALESADHKAYVAAMSYLKGSLHHCRVRISNL